MRRNPDEEPRMTNVRIGIIGLGNMGLFHVGYMNTLEGATLTALCDMDSARVDRAAKGLDNVAKFNKYQDLVNSGSCDAIIIATPHFQHGEIARAGLQKGLHVLSEKPAAVTKRDAERTNEIHAKHPHLKYALMLQMRTSHVYKKMKELIQEGDLGDVTRITWLITDWFRTWTYYASGGWRATWSGEGGGVLINQCPHNLDMMQWLLGGVMPDRVTAVAALGKTHPIEVEDEVSAILEYPSGAIGHFVTTTGEAPGTNRLEICGDHGKIVAENGKLTFHRTRKSVREIREKSPEAFAKVETWEVPINYQGTVPEGHKVVTQNFVNAILKDESLIGPGEEGVRGLELGNAMLMSGITRQPIDLPMDGDAFERFLKELDAKYGGKKKLEVRESVASDMGSSFSKP
jgi:predicted dehydrogenase